MGLKLAIVCTCTQMRLQNHTYIYMYAFLLFLYLFYCYCWRQQPLLNWRDSFSVLANPFINSYEEIMKCVTPPSLLFDISNVLQRGHSRCRVWQIPISFPPNSIQRQQKLSTAGTHSNLKLCSLFSHSLHKWIGQIRICAPYSQPPLASTSLCHISLFLGCWNRMIDDCLVGQLATFE